MGFSLMAQGAFSVCYHVCCIFFFILFYNFFQNSQQYFFSKVCPTNLSLQFDTTMMYVICILCYVKLYQFRHPDATASAYSTLFVLGVLVLIEALALYSSSWIVYGLFLFCYVGMTIFIAFDAYYLGIGKWYFLINFELWKFIYYLTQLQITYISSIWR